MHTVKAMPIEDLLMPKEEILYSVRKVYVGDQKYDAYITNKRLIFYRQVGTLFKKDDFIAIKLKDIENVMYKEEGTIKKKGVLYVELPKRKLAIYGSRDAIRGFYQNLMQYWESE